MRGLNSNSLSFFPTGQIHLLTLSVGLASPKHKHPALADSVTAAIQKTNSAGSV